MYRVLHPAIDITTPQTVDGSQGSLRIKISEERSARRLCREVGDYCGDHRPPNPEAPQAPLIFATARLPRTCSPAIRPEWRSACPAFLATTLLRVSALSGSTTTSTAHGRPRR